MTGKTAVIAEVAEVRRYIIQADTGLVDEELAGAGHEEAREKFAIAAIESGQFYRIELLERSVRDVTLNRELSQEASVRFMDAEEEEENEEAETP